MLHRFHAKRRFRWLLSSLLSDPALPACPSFPQLPLLMASRCRPKWVNSSTLVTQTANCHSFCYCFWLISGQKPTSAWLGLAVSSRSPLLFFSIDLYRSCGQSTERQVQHAWIIGSCHYNCSSSSTELDRQMKKEARRKSIEYRERERGKAEQM